MRDCTKIMMCYNFEYIKRRGTRKMKKFIEEFKTFALRGNVMVNFIIMAFILFCLMVFSLDVALLPLSSGILFFLLCSYIFNYLIKYKFNHFT